MGIITDGDIVYRLWDNVLKKYLSSGSGKSLWKSKSGPAQLLKSERNMQTRWKIVDGKGQSVSTFDPSRYEVHEFEITLTRRI